MQFPKLPPISDCNTVEEYIAEAEKFEREAEGRDNYLKILKKSLKPDEEIDPRHPDKQASLQAANIAETLWQKARERLDGRKRFSQKWRNA